MPVPLLSDKTASGFSDVLTITVSLPPSTTRCRRPSISGVPPLIASRLNA